MSDTFKGLGVQIELPVKDGLDNKERTKDAFHVVKETLTRIGVSSPKTKSLYQSCHILHKKGEYAILHFKELFSLDGKVSDINQEDTGRRNTITKLLADWGLLKIIDDKKIEGNQVPLNQIKIISYNDKKNWSLKQKYQIGGKPSQPFH